MTAVPETELTRADSEAARSIRPRRAVVGVSVGVGTYGILVDSPPGAPSGHVGGLDRRLDGVLNALTVAGGS